MNFIELFTKNEYDYRPILRKNGHDFTLEEIKKFVAFQTEKFLKSASVSRFIAWLYHYSFVETSDESLLPDCLWRYLL